MNLQNHLEIELKKKRPFISDDQDLVINLFFIHLFGIKNFNLE